MKVNCETLGKLAAKVCKVCQVLKSYQAKEFKSLGIDVVDTPSCGVVRFTKHGLSRQQEK